MKKEEINGLRNGLEDSYWYGEEDAEVFEELVREAEAFAEIDSGLTTLIEKYRYRAFQELSYGFKGSHDEWKRIADEIERIREKGLNIIFELESE